eukprot:356735-Chlamydomonas_euryale.AAC.10
MGKCSGVEANLYVRENQGFGAAHSKGRFHPCGGPEERCTSVRACGRAGWLVVTSVRMESICVGHTFWTGSL